MRIRATSRDKLLKACEKLSKKSKFPFKLQVSFFFDIFLFNSILKSLVKTFIVCELFNKILFFNKNAMLFMDMWCKINRRIQIFYKNMELVIVKNNLCKFPIFDHLLYNKKKKVVT